MRRKINELKWQEYLILVLTIIILLFSFWLLPNAKDKTEKIEYVKQEETLASTDYNGYFDNNVEGKITGENGTRIGNNETFIVKEDFSEQEIILAENRDKMCNNLPLIKINNEVEDIKLIIDATFTNEIKTKYSSYANAPKYGFALRIYFGDQSNGGYYNVIREGEKVINKGEYNGLKPGMEINNGVIWEVPLTESVPFAVSSLELGKNKSIKFLNIKSLFKSNSQLKIGAEFSPAGNNKEGCEIIHINSMKLLYIGNKGDIEIME